jgi:hypothetical protein
MNTIKAIAWKTQVPTGLSRDDLADAVDAMRERLGKHVDSARGEDLVFEYDVAGFIIAHLVVGGTVEAPDETAPRLADLLPERLA